MIIEWLSYAAAWGLCGALHYGLAMNMWYSDFGPSQHGGSGSYSILPWDEAQRESMRTQAHAVAVMGLLGPFALFATLLAWCFITGRWGFVYRWPADFYIDKPGRWGR
jgi:hypothetical protein